MLKFWLIWILTMLSTQFLAYYSSDANYADEVANLGQIEKILSLEAVRRSSP